MQTEGSEEGGGRGECRQRAVRRVEGGGSADRGQ